MGGWTLTGHPAVAEIMAAEGFHFLVADMEHTPINVEAFYHIALAAKGTDCDVLARLPSCDAGAGQAGARPARGPHHRAVGRTPAEAAQSAAMAKLPPAGIRGASLCRATGLEVRFSEYFQAHNDEVLVVVMLEHITAVQNADAILATPGLGRRLDRAVRPVGLDGVGRPVAASRRAGGAGDHPRRLPPAQVAAGIHVVPVDAGEVRRRIQQGFRFIACGIDTLFVREGCRAMLKAREA